MSEGDVTPTSCGWILLMEVTELILLYCASVDLSSRQHLPCMSKQFHSTMERVMRNLPAADIHLSPSLQDELNFHKVPLGCRLISCSVGFIVSKCGYGSGHAIRLHEHLDISDWEQWYVVLVRDNQPGWLLIARMKLIVK